MDLDEIRKILDLVREHELSEFEIEHDGIRLKIRKDSNGAHVVTHAAPAVPAIAAPAAAATPASAPNGAGLVAADLADEIELAVV
jgi:acetyl-CoA carboxylase biotin carboxyl carrier protein